MSQMFSPNHRSVDDIVRDVDTGRLMLNPPFQRRSVWMPAVKDHFIQTVLLGLPFPEIFIVIGESDPATRTRVDHLVDGQQRVATLREYLQGSTNLPYKRVKRYSELSATEQKAFLNYRVAVRDLQNMDGKTVADVFDRINSTDYALKATERYNALFTGKYRDYCEKLATHSFFVRHSSFSTADWRRMGDMTFTLTLVTTLLAGYFRREEILAEYLGMYNDNFPEADTINSQLESAFQFIDACCLPLKCRVWKKTDLFTLLVETCFILRNVRANLDPTSVGPRLTAFYESVDKLYKVDPDASAETRSVASSVIRYMKAATKATNDKYARVDRAEVISPLLIDTALPPKPLAKGKFK